MRRTMVGLLAAVGATMSALVGLVHGDLVPVIIVGASVATGMAAYGPTAFKKKIVRHSTNPLSQKGRYCTLQMNGSASSFRYVPVRRFAVCAPGLASGLALDVGGADPDTARHSVPGPVTFARRLAHMARC